MKLTLHMARTFNGIVNLNRDDQGNPKAMVVGGKLRTIFSPQFFTYHMRNHFPADLLGVSRSRYIYRHHVSEPLKREGVPSIIADEIASAIDDVTSGRKEGDKQKRQSERDTRAKLEKAEAKLEAAIKNDKGVQKARNEVDKLKAELKKEEAELDGEESEGKDEDEKKRTKELQVIEDSRAQLLTEWARDVLNSSEYKELDFKKDEAAKKKLADLVKKHFKTFEKRLTAAEVPFGALFGVKSVGDFQPERDGVIYRSFGISVVEQTAEEDYWITSDSMESLYGRGGGMGAAHINSSRYATADTFYMPLTINLTGASEMVRRPMNDPKLIDFVLAVASFVVDGPIGAKKTGTNPDIYPSCCVIAELHQDAGVSLLPYDTCPKGVDPSKWLTQHMLAAMTDNHTKLDRDVKWSAFSLVDGVFPEALTKNQFLGWIRQQLSAGK
jgi:hypothetical protein